MLRQIHSALFVARSAVCSMHTAPCRGDAMITLHMPAKTAGHRCQMPAGRCPCCLYMAVFVLRKGKDACKVDTCPNLAGPEGLLQPVQPGLRPPHYLLPLQPPESQPLHPRHQMTPAASPLLAATSTSGIMMEGADHATGAVTTSVCRYKKLKESIAVAVAS